MVSTGEEGDGGTARPEDRNGTAVTLVFASIFPESVVKKAGFKDLLTSCDIELCISRIQSVPRRDDAVIAQGWKRQRFDVESDNFHLCLGRQVL